MNGPTFTQLAADLASGTSTAHQLTSACLHAIDKDEDGRVAFVSVDRDGALSRAEALDVERAEGRAANPFAGIPIAIKDLFDVEGEVTRAGSVVLDGPPARRDAPAVAALRKAGFVFLGRSNMTEFAFSGLGMNPHYGTPTTPWRRGERHLSGGSTSGGAMAVAMGMAHAALGSDTGGSCRIPAAWCGLAGFKPTADRISREGAVPLSFTLDSIGSIARSITCCASIDAILSGEASGLVSVDPARLHFGVVTNVALDGIHPVVARAYETALSRLRDAGASLTELHFEPFDRVAELNAKGGFAAAEAYAWHRKLLEARSDAYDPRVAVRIRRGAGQDAADYIDLMQGRMRLVADASRVLDPYDALLLPTTPILPPRLEDLVQDDEYGRVNLLALRNPTLINMIDGCAASVPVSHVGDEPVGLMVAGGYRQDRRLLAISAAVEALVSS